MSVAPAAVARRARVELDAGRPVALATLVGRDGRSYLPPGAQALLGPDGPLAGLLSGGCLEDEVAARARDLRPGGPPVRLSIDTSSDEIDGLGIGCGGRLDIVVEPLSDQPGWRSWLGAIAEGRPAVRRIGPGGTVGWRTPDAAVGQAPPETALTAWAEDVQPRLRPIVDGWLQVVPAPPTLVLVGDGPEVEGLALRMGRMGWRLRWAGPSRAAAQRLVVSLRRHDIEIETLVADAATLRDADPSRRPWVLGPSDRLVAASRRLDLDAAAAAWGLRAGVRYLGVVAGRHRRTVLAERPELAGLDVARIDAPAGLAIGAEGPEEVATALAARLVSELRAAAAPVWAVIPAAGAGRRMRGAKPLLRKNGETLLARAQRMAAAACDATLVVLGHDAARLAPELHAGTVPIVADAWSEGLSASLRTALRAVPEGARVLVLLPDMPGVDADHLSALRRVGRLAAGAASRYPGGRSGAPALLPAELVDEVRAGGGPRGDVGMGAWLRSRTDLAEVALDDPADLDTAEAARAHGWFPPRSEAEAVRSDPEAPEAPGSAPGFRGGRSGS